MPFLPPHLMPPHPVDRIMADHRRGMGLGPHFDPPSFAPTMPIYRPTVIESLSPLGFMEKVFDHGDGTLSSFDSTNPFKQRKFRQDPSRFGFYVEDKDW